MAYPRFTKNGSQLQFQTGLKYPSRKPIEAIQAIERTAAGGLQVENLGLYRRRFELNFANMPADDYAALCDWFENTCQGAGQAFDYTDDESQTFTVQCLTNPLDFSETKSGFAGSLLLEEI